MAEPYSNSPVPASPATSPDDTTEERNGEHRFHPARIPDYEIGPWSEIHGWTSVDADDVSRDRMAHVYDSDIDGSIGTLTHYVTSDSFAEPNTRSDPNDARWRCGRWHEFAEEFIRVGCAMMHTLRLGIYDDPRITMIPRREGGLYVFAASWLSHLGGGVELLSLGDFGPCGACVGCANPLDRETVVESWVYFVQATNGGPVKIGRSATPRARVASLQTANAAELRIVATMPGGATVERVMHATFAADRIRAGGEWFSPSPALAALVKELGGALK